MNNPLSAFDVRSDMEEAPRLTRISVALHEFLDDTLPQLTQSMRDTLVDRMREHGMASSSEGVTEFEYDENYSLKDEMATMIVAVKAMRGEIFDGNRLRNGVGLKDVKEFVTASNSIMSTLMKSHEKLMSMERHRSIEQATVEVLKEIGGSEVVDRFVTLMESKLETREG